MAMQPRRIIAAYCAATLLLLFSINQSALAADRPNQMTHSDVAAGRWMDSLLNPNLATPTQSRDNRSRPRQSVTQRGSNLRGKLVRNPRVEDGSPPFVLVNRDGGILRYIEPVRSVDLNKHLGQTITVRHDTGDILLASQLALPRNGRAGGSGGMQLAQHLEPVPAGAPTTEDIPDPVGESVDEPIVIEGPESGPVFLEGSYDNGYRIDDGYEDDGLNFGGCPNCGSHTCRQFGGCGRGSRGVMYAHLEYSLWELEGMNTPPLVVMLPHNVADPVNPIPANRDERVILYGGRRVLDDERNGGRITFGLWLDDYGQWGVEGDYLGLEEIDDRFVAGVKDQNFPADGNFIFRPFFNTGIVDQDNNGLDLGDLASRGRALEDVDTNELDGTVAVDVRSEFQTSGIRLRHNLCCREGCGTCCGDGVGCGAGVGCGSGVAYQAWPLGRLFNLLQKGTRHTDVLYGFRWASLDESLQVTEDLQQIVVTTSPLTITTGNDIDVIDRFVVENDFYGGEIGYETEWKHRRWSLNFLSKVAIGSTRQRVAISGSTVIDDGLGNVITSPDGGLLTQRFAHPGADLDPNTTDDNFVVGNIGTFERDEFSMIPEIGLTLGYNLTQRLKITGGYTLLYWSNVVRPGDQIDLDVNANLLRRDGVPDATRIVRDDHPRFEYRQTDLWANGLNFGAEYTW